jgi:phosphatidylglycerophosphate synthase
MIHPDEAAPVFQPNLATVPPQLEAASPIQHNVSADRLRLAANALSIGRALGGACLAYRVATADYPSRTWAMTAATVALAATDYIDGKLARRATALDGDKSTFGAYADQLSDKVLVNGLMGATAVANYRKGHRLTGSLLAAATAVTTARDTWVTVKRVQAERSDVPVNTAAQKAGKVKAVVQFAGIAASVAPVMKRRATNALVQGVVLASTYMAVKSGLDYHRAYNAAMERRPSPALEALPTAD